MTKPLHLSIGHATVELSQQLHRHRAVIGGAASRRVSWMRQTVTWHVWWCVIDPVKTKLRGRPPRWIHTV